MLTVSVVRSTWGCNRVQEHQSLAPLQLILPVLTDPGVVKHAVAALHSGSVQLSLCSVEAILVLANSIGVTAVMVLNSSFVCHSIGVLAIHTLWGCRWSVWSQRAYSTCAAKRLRCSKWFC